MTITAKVAHITLAAGLASSLLGQPAQVSEPGQQPVAVLSQVQAVLWEPPDAIASRNLLDGVGGTENRPVEPFTFVREDMGGTTPKFIVRDGKGVEWTAKLGKEAQSETAATRLLWAVGYFADETYLVPLLRVRGMPKLTRGQNLVEDDGSMRNARLEHSFGEGRFVGSWKWSDNPFSGTKELNGLRVLMALLNNWDLKDSNTAVYAVRDPEKSHYTIGSAQDARFVYLISDVGASFGANHYMIPNGKSNAKKYANSKFVKDSGGDTVDFRSPGRAPLLSPFVIPHFFNMLYSTQMEWICRDIPREHVRWIGGLLSQLSKDQLRDAFKAANYSPEEVETFAEAVAVRIAQLTDL